MLNITSIFGRNTHKATHYHPIYTAQYFIQNMKKKNMEQPKEQQENDQAAPATESEALKSADTINAEKKNKAPVTDDDLPGYPHYPSGEDMLNPSSGMDRVEVDVEHITRGGNVADADMGVPPVIPPPNSMEQPVTDEVDDDEDDLGIVPGTEADVTAEDLLLLGPKDQDMDMGEDEDLQNKGFPLAMTGDDLDVPEGDDEGLEDNPGEEDEENDYYSLGGDSKEGLEEDQAGAQ